MMSLRNILLAGAAAAAVGVGSPAAYAGLTPTLSTNQWYTGAFGSSNNTALYGPGYSGQTGTNGPVLPSGSANAVMLPDGTWAFNLPYGGTLLATDVELSGDQFEFFANSVAVGTTSTPTDSATNVGENIGDALANPDFSSGTFTLPAGSDVIITGELVTTVGPGDFDFIVQADSAPIGTPEPATLSVLGAGLAGLGAIRRRRKKAI
jgi:PEP-CTERM motif